MTTKKKKEELGKGIRAILGEINDEWQQEGDLSKEEVERRSKSHSVNVPLNMIEVNPFQPRADFNEEGLKELAESIKIHGVIQPITIRAIDGERFQLIAGERRLRASKMAGKEDIPAYVRMADDQEMLEIALIENIQREDLNAIEIAVNYKRLMEECELNQEALGQRLGKKRTTVTNYLRLLKLPPDIQEGIKSKKISMGHARAIISVDDPVLQLDIYKEAVAKQLSVRKVEELVRQASKPKKKKDKEGDKALPLAYRRIQDELTSRFSTKVTLKQLKGEKGEIVISYFSDDDLNRIIDQLTEGD